MSGTGNFGPFGKIDNLRLLELILAKNTEIYENGSLQDQRDAIANCLLSVASYLSENGIDLRHLKPLLHPVEALNEREKNRLDLIFCERAREGKPNRSLKQDQKDGVIAAVANHWLRNHADKTTPMASRLSAVARMLSGPVLGKVSATRVKQAREIVSQESADHPSRVMATTVNVWLELAAADVGAERSIEVILPLIQSAQLFTPHDDLKN